MTNEEILKDIGHPDLILSFPVFTAMTAAREEGRREGAIYNWISVEEDTPDYGQLVWVYNPKAVVKQYSIFFMPFNGNEKVGVFTNGGTTNDCDITHWMPLPAEPPQKPNDNAHSTKQPTN